MSEGTLTRNIQYGGKAVNLSNPDIQGDDIWCPLCRRYTKFLRITKAAKIVDVHRRTVYRYIESGEVQVVKVIGKTIRVCSGCLLRFRN
jgi:excisionase family DNA binding protein